MKNEKSKMENAEWKNQNNRKRQKAISADS